ncbi:F-box/kelch-repeat protein [Carex littledalei]|uniref:F-box/kelch-repeat protein n=1 Tax=Carex littledalei TaxID=544730 RepID=A0A833Q7V7_9POAL|nr:F-box/kelch-repeat protein [Carex littledalei]
MILHFRFLDSISEPHPESTLEFFGNKRAMIPLCNPPRSKMLLFHIPFCLTFPLRIHTFYTDLIHSLQHEALIPGLPDDLALRCLARISHGYHGLLECVSKKWRDTIRSEEYARLKALAGWCGNWIFVSTANVCNKFLMIGGQTLSSINDQEVLSDVLVFDPFKKEWYMAARMGRARLGLACAAISGKVYVAGGHDLAYPLGFSDAEVYDPCTDRWDHLPPMSFPLVGCFGLPRGEQFYVIGRKEPSTTQYTHIIFSIVEYQWQVLENTDPYINFGLSSVIDEMLYVFDEETVKENSIFCAHHGRPLRPFGACLVGSKRRLYLIGGLTLKFDTQSRAYSVVKLNSTRFCEVTRLPLEWQDARPMLSQAGRVVGHHIVLDRLLH